MTTYNYYQHLKKSAVKILFQNGISIKEAFTTVKMQMPYLFASKAMTDQIEKANQLHDAR